MYKIKPLPGTTGESPPTEVVRGGPGSEGLEHELQAIEVCHAESRSRVRVVGWFECRHNKSGYGAGKPLAGWW